MQNPKSQVNIETDGPLSEKDEQAKAVEKMKCLQYEALEKLRKLREKTARFSKDKGESK